MSYFTADPKMLVVQESRKIPSRNGLNYKSSQKVEIFIDPESVQYFNPRQTFLKLQVDIQPNSLPNMYLQLDPDIGGSCLIKDIRIRTGSGVELENIQNYNRWVKVKYLYQDSNTTSNRKDLMEGTNTTADYNFNTKGQNKIFKGGNVQNNVFFSNKAELVLPLHTGIFSNTNGMIFPNILCNGLHIELTLESDDLCIKTFNRGLEQKRTPQIVCNGAADPTSATEWATATEDTTFYLQKDINCSTIRPGEIPFKVGERISAYNETTGAVLDALGTFKSVAESTTHDGYLEVVLNAAVTTTSAIPTDSPVASTEYAFQKAQAGYIAPTYLISNVELVVGVVYPPQVYLNNMKSMMTEGNAKNALLYDIQTIQNYRHSITASNTKPTIVLPLNNQFCKSVIIIPELVSVPTTYTENMNGQLTDIKDYQFFYQNKMNPDRPVNTENLVLNGLNQQPLHETMKALRQAGLDVNNMRNFKKDFIIGRAVSVGNNVADLHNQDFQLNMTYGTKTGEILLNCLVSHIRVIQFTDRGIVVEL